MHRQLWAGASLLLLAGCGERQAEKRAAEELRTFDVSAPPSAVTPTAPPAPPPPVASPPLASSSAQTEQSADGAGPNVSVTAAPGVAFNYRYAYRLANARIQAAQEAHAQMCEKLTVARCRITGMR